MGAGAVRASIGRRWASLILALALLACARIGRADAAVVPQNILDAALASAKNLKQQPVPNTVLKFPYYQLGRSDAQGFVDTDSLDYGYLANGADLLIVPLVSGGSGGVFSTLLFRSVRAKPDFVGVLTSPSGHLNVHLESGRIVVITPIYAAGDPNCCPSAHRVVRYTLAGGKLRKLDEFRTR